MCFTRANTETPFFFIVHGFHVADKRFIYEHMPFLCQEPESNWGHKDFQSSALPTELSRLYVSTTVQFYVHNVK